MTRDLKSSNLHARLTAAMADQRAGRRDAARNAYEAILVQYPGQPDAAHFLGLIALEERNFALAIALIAKAARAQPKNQFVQNNLGNAYRAAGRPAEAMAFYKRAIKLSQRYAVPYSNLAIAQSDLGSHAEAIPSFTHALELDPRLIEAATGLAASYRALGDLESASAVIRNAVALHPARADLVGQLASLLGQQDKFDEAFALHEKALLLQPASAQFQVDFALSLYRAREFARAEIHFRQAIARDAKTAASWNALGRTLRVLGKLVEAKSCFDRALVLDPALVDAHRNAALMSDAGKNGEKIDALRVLLGQPALKAIDKAITGFALGKCLDDKDRFDEAFEAYANANQIIERMKREAGKGFHFANLQRQVDGLIAKKDVAGPFIVSDLPVFIVGMPRSGTSLVEQIAASHSQIHGAGELRKINRLSAALASDDGSAMALARTHLDELRQLGGTAKRVIDKMPDNIFYLDTVAAFYPGAKIIFCVREPRDVSLSCYFQQFSSGNEFSYNLVDCGRREVQTARLMRHWQNTLPLAMLTVSYERLVESLEEQSRRIIDFLELAWEPGCLEFYRTNRAVATASGWQVRQPLYNRSVGRWRHYRNHLGELEAVLANG